MIKAILNHLKTTFAFSQTDRVWQLPFFAAMAVGVVLFVGILCEKVNLALVAILGVYAILYVPNTPIYHRMAVIMCCSFGIITSFALGFLTHFLPLHLTSILLPIIVGLVSAVSSILVRYYNLSAPGYFFFAVSCILGAFLPYQASDFVFLVGVVSLGAIVANIMAFLYSLSVIYWFKNKLPDTIPEHGHLGFDVIVVESLIIGVSVSLALLLGNIMGLERSYWVAISCVAIMQGATLNAVWFRQIQRIIGTFAGMLFTMWLVNINFNDIEFAIVITFLMFMGEFCVVRNYALAMVFFTPLTIYLVEIGHFMLSDADVAIKARMIDTIIGSIIGLFGGFMLYQKRLRAFFRRLAYKIFRNHS